GDGFTGSVTIAEHLREQFPDLPIHAGGPQCSWFGEAIYRRTRAFTSLTHGEGEQVIRELAAHARGERDLSEIPGLIFMDGGQARTTPPAEGLEMDSLPEPVYDEAVYPAMAGNEKIKIIVLDDSRGCPYHCAFCMHPIESGRRLRTASAGLLVDRMQQIMARHRITAFRFSGSSTPGELMAEVADEILRRQLQVTYTCFGHFRSARPDHFEVMARSGLHAIFFGIESGCQSVLERAVGRKVDLRTVKQTVQAAQAAGIFVVASMIVPLPFDTEQTIAQSLQFLLDVRPDSVPVQFPGVIPPTPWGRDPERYGFELDPDELNMVGMQYKIKLLFPPSMWEPAPYRLSGMDFRQFTALTMSFAAQLEQAGILVGVPDDNALIARCAGMSARQMRDLSRLWCTIGDADAMGEMVARANVAIMGG
ncbi:MAG TPA: radical SAM protein, partial [Armatimonadota bacterium]|nr:radical SAM protein [Armatimonadota bacterium]